LAFFVCLYKHYLSYEKRVIYYLDRFCKLKNDN